MNSFKVGGQEIISGAQDMLKVPHVKCMLNSWFKNTSRCEFTKECREIPSSAGSELQKKLVTSNKISNVMVTSPAEAEPLCSMPSGPNLVFYIN